MIFKQGFNTAVPIVVQDLSCMKINRPPQISQVLPAYQLLQCRLIFILISDTLKQFFFYLCEDSTSPMLVAYLFD